MLALTEESWTTVHVLKEYGESGFLLHFRGRTRRANAGWARNQSLEGQTNLTSKGVKNSCHFLLRSPCQNMSKSKLKRKLQIKDTMKAGLLTMLKTLVFSFHAEECKI